MAEYVEKNDVIELITRRYENPEICTQEINSIPAADVAPVVHGRWIEGPLNPYCSECFVECRDETPFCPNCGAKMYGGGSDEAN